MTAQDIIEAVKEIKPNVYSDSKMLVWLNEAEQDIHEVLNKYKKEPEDFLPHESTADELLLGEARQNIYIYYLCSQIDYANAEINLYNNDVSVYTQLFEDFAKLHRRANMPEKNTKITGGM